MVVYVEALIEHEDLLLQADHPANNRPVGDEGGYTAGVKFVHGAA